ncbi:flagellar hook-associated protein FlgL [Bacillus testis]|uniref:flagellar hook-associated protein FlgL n=1 Tax=Bacillus testis TaxID=1622072 RepID=UPI00067F5EE3|nr:flagellar hook-associated protein FlgL [Bacillus testis]
MRVTQSMISNNTLRHISDSYSKLAQLDEQISTGKKFSKPSDDPVAAMRAMGYRSDLNNIQQYQQNIGEVKTWVDSTDDALNQAVLALQKIRELTVEASNGSLESNQRSYVATEIEQLKEQIGNIADTQIGGKFIFNGVNTQKAPTKDGFYEGSTDQQSINLEVFPGITLPLNTPGKDLFQELTANGDNDPLQSLINDLKDTNSSESTISGHLSEIDKQIDKFLTARANVGAKQNRVELMDDRLNSQEVISTQILSDNENVEVEKVIMDLTMQEAVHRAALGVGAKIMQPSLMDFLR